MSHELICTWLGLPPGDWPPDHYRLLDLEPGESDCARIEQRVHDRLEAVRRYQLLHPDLVTEAMNRLAQAYVCLTDPEARRAYDAAQSGRPTPNGSKPPPVAPTHAPPFRGHAAARGAGAGPPAGAPCAAAPGAAAAARGRVAAGRPAGPSGGRAGSPVAIPVETPPPPPRRSRRSLCPRPWWRPSPPRRRPRCGSRPTRWSRPAARPRPAAASARAAPSTSAWRPPAA